MQKAVGAYWWHVGIHGAVSIACQDSVEYTLGVAMTPSVARSHKSLYDVVQLRQLGPAEMILVTINHVSIKLASPLTLAKQVVYMKTVVNVSNKYKFILPLLK